jgi:hypothetical protein
MSQIHIQFYALTPRRESDQTASDPKAKQMTRYLGGFEEAAVLTNEHAPFNLVGIVHLSSPPSEDVLRQALSTLQTRHPLLRARIEKHAADMAFTFEGIPPIPLHALDRESDEHWLRVAEERLNQFIDSAAGPLVQFTLLQPRDGAARGEIIFSAHHAILDGDSALHLVHETLALCEHIQKGMNVDRSEIRAVQPPADQLFPRAYKKPRYLIRLFPFLARQMLDEVRFRLRNLGKEQPPVHPGTCCRILPLRLPEEQTTALIRVSRKRQVTLNSVLNAALVMAVWKHRYSQQPRPLRSITFANLRPYLKPPVAEDHVGGYISMLQFTLNMERGQEFWPFARKIHEKVYRAARRGEKFLAAHMTKTMMQMMLGQRSARMGAAALSYAGPLKIERSYGDTRILGLNGFISNFDIGPEYTAMVFLFDGELHWNILYLDQDMSEQEARTIGDEILNLLREASLRET